MADEKLSTFGPSVPVDTDHVMGISDPGGTPANNNYLVSRFDKTGKKSMPIPAAAIRPTITAGCATYTGFETTAGRPDIKGLDFDGSSIEHAQFDIALPKSFDFATGTITFEAYWTSKTNTGTETVLWELAAVAVTPGDTIDVAFGTFVGPAADANTSAVEEQQATAESGAVTIAGSPANGDMIYFDIRRDPTTDTMTEDATLIGLKLFLTTLTGNDA